MVRWNAQQCGIRGGDFVNQYVSFGSVFDYIFVESRITRNDRITARGFWGTELEPTTGGLSTETAPCWTVRCRAKPGSGAPNSWQWLPVVCSESFLAIDRYAKYSSRMNDLKPDLESIEPPVPTVHSAPQHLARRFLQVCDSLLCEVFAPHDLQPRDYALVVQLRMTPGLDRTRLGIAIGRDATSTGEALDRLEARGWVARRLSPNDRRAWQFNLTEAGEAFHTSMRPSVTAASQRILAPLSATEADALIGLLSKIVIAHESIARPGAGRRTPTRKGKTARGKRSRT